MASNTISTTIILVTWNSLSNVKTTIDSLFNSNSRFKLVIVDNGSNTETIEYLRNLQIQKNVRLIFNAENYGVVKARSQALELVDTQYVYYSDSDIYFPSFDWLGVLEEYLRNDDSIGIVGPLKTSNKFIHPYSGVNLRDFWDHIADKDISLERKLSEFTDGKDFDQFHNDICARNKNAEKIINIPPRAISACALLTRTDIAKDKKLSDPEYIKGLWGMEDVDFSWEVHKAGYKVVKATDLYIHHFGHASIKESETDIQQDTNFINLQYFFKKWSREVSSWLENCIDSNIDLNGEELYRALKNLPLSKRPPRINALLQNKKDN